MESSTCTGLIYIYIYICESVQNVIVHVHGSGVSVVGLHLAVLSTGVRKRYAGVFFVS